MTGWIQALADAPVYLGLMAFLGLYPVVTGLYWIVAAALFSFHRERHDPAFYALDEHPFVSILVAAHDEEAVIEETVERLLELDWPAFDVTVVDDGSTDRTSELLLPLADAGRIRLLTKQVNEGKAMALNDALPLLPGEIVLIVDADGRPQPDALRWIVPHFVKVRASPRSPATRASSTRARCWPSCRRSSSPPPSPSCAARRRRGDG
jgi:poly-beta-1,6-N-acetyl-D-glucosamine synthase